MKVFGYLCLIPVLMILSPIWSGYALSILWRWFMVPLFGFCDLSIPYAIGLTLIVRFLTHIQVYDKDNREHFNEKLVFSIAIAIFSPAFVLLFGWIIHMFC